MEAFIAYFENMAPWQRLAWVAACLFLTWVLEAGIPLVRKPYAKWRHARTNLILLAGVIAVNLLFGALTIYTLDWTSPFEIGLFQRFAAPPIVQLVVTFFTLDLVAQYFAHYLLHRVPWLWKLHTVHHSDTMLDATSGTRLHPGDFLSREVLSLIVLLLLGTPLAFYLFYRFCTVFFTYMTHANISLPPRVDKALSLVFITPNMHKFHHHDERPWTDSNFGNIFSIWDRLFGTFVYDDTSRIRYGLDILDPSKTDDLRYQFTAPFRRKA